ncbi:MAG: DUF4380 domain-containing protein [Bacteroidales bacterium]|nr:DUF4380 domain-containing protein [Bacteroidales bacterium]
MRILVLVLLLFAFCNALPSSWIDKGDGTFMTSVNNRQIIISSQMGGRILSFSHCGKELLIGKDIHEQNYGATLWISPQSKWGWPPYPTLDIEPYSSEIRKDTLFLTSAIDSISGFQVKKSFVMNDYGALDICYTIKNCTDSIKQIAPWDVCRVKKGISCFPVDERARISSKLENNDMIRWVDTLVLCTTLQAEYEKKIFAASTGGWLAHFSDSLLFIKRFPDISVGDLPPNQGEVEIFVAKKGIYVELENHGKYQKLSPGECLHYQQLWTLQKMPYGIDLYDNGSLMKEIDTIFTYSD